MHAHSVEYTFIRAECMLICVEYGMPFLVWRGEVQRAEADLASFGMLCAKVNSRLLMRTKHRKK